MNNELIIDVSQSEMSIALLQDKQLVELSKEKSNSKFSVGDIYLGRVKKIMPGLNAAFVDVGYERDAFLHYLDLGPQFQSLNDYVKIAITGKNIPKLQNFCNKPSIEKTGKITDVLKYGQHVLIQIAKEPISTKGPRISSEISIAGRHLVLIPFSDKVSISQKINSSEEKTRLKRLIASIKPENYGVIVRTVAENKGAAQLDTELRGLIEKWENAFNNIKEIEPPQLIIGELNRASTILRDVLNSSFENIIVNSSTIFQEIKDYIETIAPEKQKIVKLYSGRTPIFENFGIAKQIKHLFGKTVTFKNGAYLIIEHTEALHSIDVNSGNRAKKSNDQETNALDVNMAAADEIARQLRLRDMGGIIVVDFIDMVSAENRKKLFDHVKKIMSKDRTKHNILPLSKFGLMQITRQRVRPEMNIRTLEKCPTCNGTGEIAPSILFIDKLENFIKYILDKGKLETYSLILKVHPFVAAYLTKGVLSLNLKWSIKYKLKLSVKGEMSLPYLGFHFYDKSGNEIK